MARLLTVAADVGDADSTRTVWAIVALLVVMGLALVMLAFWVRRTTRPDPEFLAPLELMDDRSWRKGDAVWQRRRLDEVRPEGATPRERAAAPPRLDESFDAGPSVSGFDDLHDDAHGRDDDADGDGLDVAPRAASNGQARADVIADSDGDAGDGDTGDDPVEDSVDAPGDAARTPIDAQRPPLDQLPDGEVDESALKRALDELDAELEHGRGDR